MFYGFIIKKNIVFFQKINKYESKQKYINNISS